MQLKANGKGFMLWEALTSCGVAAMALQALWNVSLAVVNASGSVDRQQAAQLWAINVSNQLGAGAVLSGRVPLLEALLPQGVACLREHPPWRLIAVRWQLNARYSLPECQGAWPSAQQLCLDEASCL